MPDPDKRRRSAFVAATEVLGRCQAVRDVTFQTLVIVYSAESVAGQQRLMGRINPRSVVGSAIIAALALIFSASVAAKPADIDLDGDHKADLLWYNAATGQTATWLMNGASMTGAALLLTHPDWKVIQTPDLNGDGKADLLWYNAATAQTAVWLMNGTSQIGAALLLTHPDWKVIQTPDLNGDGKADLLWYNAATGQTSVWLMDGMTVIGSALLLTHPDWKVIQTPDLNGDGRADLLWYNAATGQTSVWLMDGLTPTGFALLLTDPNWKVTQTPDLNGDGKADLLWYNATSGQTSTWLMDGANPIAFALLLADPNWKVIRTLDLNGDGKEDLLWYNFAAGQTAVWLMSGNSAIGAALLLTDPNWEVAQTADLSGDGKADLVWYNFATGETSVWLMNGTSAAVQRSLLADPNWRTIPGEAASPGQLTCFPSHGTGTDGVQLYDPSNLFAYSTSAAAGQAGAVTLTWGAQYSFSANLGPFTGSLRATLWAVTAPFGGGSISGYVLGRFPANFTGGGAFTSSQLRAGGSSYSDINGSVLGTNPPAGKYCVVMTLDEYFGPSCGATGYCIVDWLQFSGPATFN